MQQDLEAMNLREKKREETSKIGDHQRQEDHEAYSHQLKMEEMAFLQQQKMEKEQSIEDARLQKNQIKQQILDEDLKREADQTAAKKSEFKSKKALRDIAESQLRREENDKLSASRRERILGWLKILLISLLIVALLLASFFGLYRLYRWSTEALLIKEIEKRVEVEIIVEKEIPVEKIVEKVIEKEVPVEKIVEKEVIPEECTQIRRNGRIYVSCDGVKIDGSPTIGDSGVIFVPELVTDK
jgi:hypothetical protein